MWKHLSFKICVLWGGLNHHICFENTFHALYKCGLILFCSFLVSFQIWFLFFGFTLLPENDRMQSPIFENAYHLFFFWEKNKKYHLNFSFYFKLCDCTLIRQLMTTHKLWTKPLSSQRFTDLSCNFIRLLITNNHVFWFLNQQRR